MLQASQKSGEEKDWPYFRMFPYNIQQEFNRNFFKFKHRAEYSFRQTTEHFLEIKI